MIPRHLLVAALVGIGLLAAACGGSSGSGINPNPSVVHTAAPNFQAFLRLPVATPSACPKGQNGTTVGRVSVWAGRVDLSVFVTPGASATATKHIGAVLRADPRVHTTYFETQTQAYEEFQRLYTCWKDVSTSETPASYRVDLGPTVSISQRNQLVATVARLPDVDSVACNPLVPCTSSLPAATAPAPTASP